MDQPFLFPTHDRPPLAAKLAPRLQALAEKGIYIGTGSWKYDGWLGQVYTPERYSTRGKFSKKKFEEECLAEYAETFLTVSGDFAFYQFPTPEYWQRLFSAVPASFVFGFKVTEDITVARWPNHERYGTRAGQVNESFLNPTLFRKLYLERLLPHSRQVGPLMFEFGTFPKSTFPTPDDFYARLDPFLSALPPGPRYAVEVRNPEYLGPEYFSLLSRHNVAHAFTCWTRAPALGDQLDMPGSFTADFSVVRAVMPRGLSYEAGNSLSPFDRVQAPQPDIRAALRRIIGLAEQRKTPAFLYVHNPVEGNAPGTIDAVISDQGNYT